MKILLLGCNGQLGLSLADCTPSEHTVIGVDLPDLDITDAGAILELCKSTKPDVIVNVAAYTAVDQAEAEPEIATAVNVDGPRNIALAAQDVGARMIHISTDFVFEGTASTPYSSTASTHPLSVYGRTKRDGELAALEETGGSAVVIRTSWLYSKYGKNFVKTMLTLMSERDELSVVADQIGTPTWAGSLADTVWRFVDAPDARGMFHWADEGQASWHEFALAIQDEALDLGILSKKIPVHAIGTDDYPTAATRPHFSVLDTSGTCETLSVRPTEWRSNLRTMLADLLISQRLER